MLSKSNVCEQTEGRIPFGRLVCKVDDGTTRVTMTSHVGGRPLHVAPPMTLASGVGGVRIASSVRKLFPSLRLVSKIGAGPATEVLRRGTRLLARSANTSGAISILLVEANP
ncbi:hypothetical protein R1flu_011703 [Riccia fluitans]|uniref:Uncharacterized protein n=1 Tax=Riccia fluitans TaxID=41844 RepID=A0ABD1Z8X1_9MARC